MFVDGIVLAPVPDPENRAVTYLGLHKSPVVFVDRAINRHFDHFVEVLALLVENGAGKSTCVKVFLPASVLQLLDTFTSKASLFSCVHRWARSIAASPSCTSTRARLETFRSQRTFLWATQKKGFFGHPESRSNARGDAPAPKNPRVITAKSNRT